MKEIQLTQGKVALVDDGDYDYLSQFKWHVEPGKRTWYAKAYLNGCRRNGSRATKMHRLLLNAQAGQQVDHRDGNGLNNQRGNLRFATPQQNAANGRSRRDGQFKGVIVERIRKGRAKTGEFYTRYRAGITYNYKEIYLGRFLTAEDAAYAYDVKAIELFGDFAKLNLPKETHDKEKIKFARGINAAFR